MPPRETPSTAPVPTRDAELVLRRFGFARAQPKTSEEEVRPSFWVQAPGFARRLYPVFVAPPGAAPPQGLDRWIAKTRTARSSRAWAIVVVPDDRTAEEAWGRFGVAKDGVAPEDLSILVVPATEEAAPGAHWFGRVAERSEVLRISTGIVTGLFRRAQKSEGQTPVDFEEMLTLLRQRFGIDVHRSLGVRSDEDALFMLYQLATRDSYAPGDSGASLHLLVLKPTGPAARLPWFAA